MKRPDLGSPDLAYETGLHIGDGCLSHYAVGDYRYVISGNLQTEFEYYTRVVSPLLTDLYGLTPNISHYHNSIYATVWSKSLVAFKSEELGLPIGVKDTLKHLPASIVAKGKLNSGQLLAGLYDADGSVKVRKTPSGNYPRISFVQKSRTIVEDVHLLLREDFGITSTMYRNDYYDSRVGKTEVRWFLDINGRRNFHRFVEGIGTRHPSVQPRLQAF